MAEPEPTDDDDRGNPGLLEGVSFDTHTLSIGPDLRPRPGWLRRHRRLAPASREVRAWDFAVRGELPDYRDGPGGRVHVRVRGVDDRGPRSRLAKGDLPVVSALVRGAAAR